jgi:predicted flap endonuclease-1-like 5' DNA nuclease
MAVITNPKEWPVDNQEVRVKKGPLVKVEIGPGQFRKMYRSDAERLGLIKAQAPAPNKMQLPAENKAPEPEPEQESAPEDDFTAIPGVGKAAARALAAHGVATFDDLRAAGELDYLSEKVNQAIAEWRNG